MTAQLFFSLQDRKWCFLFVVQSIPAFHVFMNICCCLVITIQNNNRKRKQHSSSGPANSTGTGTTVGPSPNSPASTTHTAGDGITTASSLQHVNSGHKGLMMYGSDAAGLASSANQLVCPSVFLVYIHTLTCVLVFLCNSKKFLVNAILHRVNSHLVNSAYFCSLNDWRNLHYLH